MKTILSLLFTAFALTAFGANPSFQSFDTNQFDTSGNHITIEPGALVTNLNGIYLVTTHGALGGTNDDTAVFQSLLSIPGATVVIPYRTNGFTVGNLHVTNSVTFINNGSVLFFKTNATGYCIDTHNNTNYVLSDLRIDGQNVSNYVSLLPASTVTRPYPETYLNYTRHGIGVNMEGGKVTGCKVSNFSGACYRGYNQNGGSSEAFTLTTFSGNNAHDSLMGFDFNAFTNTATAEYSSLVELNAEGCMYGIKVGAGNIRVVASTFSGNGVGHLLQGGTNPNHGQFVGCTLNHNVYPINGEGVATGEIYNGCQILANTGPIYLNGVAGLRFVGCQFGDPIRMFITNTVSVFAPTLVLQNCGYFGKWINNAITNASTTEIVRYGNVSVDAAADNDNPWLFTAINTGDFNPQFGWGNTVSNANGGVYYYQGRRSDGLTYEVGVQGDSASGHVFQHTRGAGNLGTTYASILGNAGFVSQLSDIETNTAPYAIRTNEFALNTFYTNNAQRSYVQVTVGLLSGVGGNAQVSLYIDQEQNGSFERTGISEALTGIAASATNSIGAFIQPSGRFVFTNLSSGGGAANIQANSSEWVRQ